MRVFIAIDIDEQLRRDIAELQNELREAADIKRGQAKWVNPENIHLTLKFLGQISDRQVVEVCRIAEQVAAEHERFEIEVGGVGYFGSSSARVLWVGAGADCRGLIELQGHLEARLAEAGYPKEARRYTGHLTLCRVRNARAGVKLAQLTDEHKDRRLGTVPARAVTVYQSELTRTGPVYTVLGRYELR